MMRICGVFIAATVAMSALAQRIQIPAGSAGVSITIDASMRQGASLQLVFSDSIDARKQSVSLEVPDDFPSEIYDAVDIFINVSDTTIKTTAPLQKSAATVELQLSVKDGELSVFAKGSAMKAAVGGIPLDLAEYSDMELNTNDRVAIKSFLHKFHPAIAISRSKFTSLEELEEYLASSDDACEGFWNYFDRKTDPLKAGIGGRYSVATVATESGYDIVYITGADINQPMWEPLSIKGRLVKDTLDGTFLLEWIDADGGTISYETSATIEGNILTLAFPYWKSTLRFVKRH